MPSHGGLRPKGNSCKNNTKKAVTVLPPFLYVKVNDIFRCNAFLKRVKLT